MALLHIPIIQIDEDRIAMLISVGALESRDIEYKRESYGNSDNDVAELLADISSFANTAGGDILIGVDAEKGVPKAIMPLTIDLDAEILRLDQIARSTLQPRIAQLQFQPISLKNGGKILLIRVPRSYNPPHRIVRNGKGGNRFWARASNGKYEPNVDELRALFTLAPQLADKIRDFRLSRIAKIAASDTPVSLQDKYRLALHIVPFAAFDPSSSVSVAQINEQPFLFPPLGRTGVSNHQVNFDGVLTLSNANDRENGQRAYAQAYRTGIVEAVVSSIARPVAQTDYYRLYALHLERDIIISTVRYTKALQGLGIEPPYALMVSVLGVKGVQMSPATQGGYTDPDELVYLDRNEFLFNEVILESVPNSNQSCGLMLRPLIEQIANMAGLAQSSSYGHHGEYVHMFG